MKTNDVAEVSKTIKTDKTQHNQWEKGMKTNDAAEVSKTIKIDKTQHNQ